MLVTLTLHERHGVLDHATLFFCEENPSCIITVMRFQAMLSHAYIDTNIIASKHWTL